jgi:2-dehydropantoate 2-reductase
MKVAVIGAGAMGSLYGGYLSQSGHEVYLIDVWKDHVDKINSDGLKIIKNDRELTVYPRATSSATGVGTVDLAIIFVKSIMTQRAVEQNIELIGPETIVLSLQNGYGNIEQIEKFVDRKRIIAGTTAHGATMIGPGIIKHAGEGQTHIGSVTGTTDLKIEAIWDMLNKSGFNTTVSNNVLQLIWSKLIVNIGINALTAILQVKNGQLLNLEETRKIMIEAVKEAVEVANKLGMIFDLDETVNNVMEVARGTSENKSSMLQDVLNGRKTEIDAINGAVLKEGLKVGVSTPVNMVLTSLIKSKEKTG